MPYVGPYASDEAVRAARAKKRSAEKVARPKKPWTQRDEQKRIVKARRPKICRPSKDNLIG